MLCAEMVSRGWWAAAVQQLSSKNVMRGKNASFLPTMLCAEMISRGLVGGGAGSPPVSRLLDRYSSCRD